MQHAMNSLYTACMLRFYSNPFHSLKLLSKGAFIIYDQGGVEESTRESGKILVPPKNADQILVPPPLNHRPDFNTPP